MRLLLGFLFLCAGTPHLPAHGEAKETPLEAARRKLKAAGLEIDLKKREVRVDVTFCLAEGILEFLVCKEQTFEHETVFSTKCPPSLLRVALELVGHKPTPIGLADLIGLVPEGKKTTRVKIDVELEENGERQRCSVNEFLVNRENEDGEVPENWVFTGSLFFERDGKKYFAADSSGILVGLLAKGAGVIEFGERLGNPYHGDDLGLELNAEVTPKVGTKAVLIFSPYKKGK